MIQIKELNRAQYENREFRVTYTTDGYYEIAPAANGFSFVYHSFEKPRTMSFTDRFYSEWLEEPVAFGAFDGDHLLGFVEGNHEVWNNRYRISNLCIFEQESRGQGLGSRLIGRILQEAEASGARMAVLETQSCNVRAIAFYRKHEFSVIGFDLYSYSNEDPQRKEIRIEMGRKL